MRIGLREWIRSADEGAKRQALFVLEDVLPLVGTGLDYEDWNDAAFVIGEHVSKSVRLPVYEMCRDDLGLRIVMRNNFHDWKLSVESVRAIGDRDGLLASLFHATPPVEPKYTGDELHRVYFEGFHDDDIFGYYSKDQRRWSARIGCYHAMWTTVFHVMRELEAIGPMVWRTRESHAAELEAQAERRRARSGARP